MTEEEHEKKSEHKHHEHNHEYKAPNEHSHKKKKNSTEKVRENPWILSTVVLAVLVIILIATSGGCSGDVVSEDQASQGLLGFLNQQTEGGVEYVASEDLGSLYKVTVSYQEQEIPVHVTKDGRYYIQGLVDLDEELGGDSPDSGSDASNTSQEPIDVPKADVPEVELFIMSYCPYGTQAEKGILPVLNLLGDKIDFELRFVYYAMHPSSGEVEEQLNQYCIQKEQEDKLYEYLECFLTEGDSEGCLTSTGINKVKLKTCTDAADAEFEITINLEDESSWLSGRYPLFNIDKALNEQYEVGGSPTLVINGEKVSSARDSVSYLNAVCSSFTEGNVPEECSTTEISSEALSPGFGWTTASGGSASAQCA